MKAGGRMACPYCGSEHIQRDYPPGRAYALLTVGLALLFAGRYLQPNIFTVPPAEITRFLTAGGLLAALGMWDILRHGNRFCAACGFRFRAFPQSQKNFVCCPPPTAVAQRQEEKTRPLDRNTPIEPILACLRFKDESMRRDAISSLRQLTGQDFGDDIASWEKWWKENKDRYYAERRRTNSSS